MNVKRIIQTAQQAGIKIGLPGERRPLRKKAATPVGASQGLFAPKRVVIGAQHRDYELPASQTLKAERLPFGNHKAQQHFVRARSLFKTFGLDAALLEAGHTYLLLYRKQSFGHADAQLKNYTKVMQRSGGSSDDYPDYREVPLYAASRITANLPEKHALKLMQQLAYENLAAIDVRGKLAGNLGFMLVSVPHANAGEVVPWVSARRLEALSLPGSAEDLRKDIGDAGMVAYASSAPQPWHVMADHTGLDLKPDLRGSLQAAIKAAGCTP